METIRKERREAPAGFFEVEAAGLSWLGDAGRVRVASVVAVGTGFIELERLTSASPTPAAARAFGAALALLHDAGASGFGVGPDGWEGDGFIGDAPLPLRRHDTWGTFYGRDRCAVFARAARRRGALDDDGLGVIEALTARLAAGAFDDDAPPARLHGDLWSGNVLWPPEGVALIDPAAHGGHRITDLAMLGLFGTPHLSTILDAYEATSTRLPEGWRALIELHQVHPLLVHAALFGGGYGAQAVRAARPYL